MKQKRGIKGHRSQRKSKIKAHGKSKITMILTHAGLLVPLMLAFAWFAQLTTRKVAYDPGSVIMASPARRDTLVLTVFVFIVAYSLFLLVFYAFVLRKKQEELITVGSDTIRKVQ